MRSRSTQLFIVAISAIVVLSFVLSASSATQPVTIADQSLRGHNPTLPTTDRNGGPDAFGYVYLDQAEPNGPTFSWIAHTDSAVTLPTTAWSNVDNGYAGPYTLPFSFPFYGTNYTSIYFETNGYLTFGSTYTSYSSGNMPFTNYPASILFWSYNMTVGNAGTVVRYQTFQNPTRFVITYDSLSYYNSGNYRVSAQIILSADGSIVIQYRNLLGGIATSYPGTAGIQTSGGTQYLQYSPPVPGEGTAVKFFKPCYLVSNPSPANGVFQVPVNTTFTWSRGTCTANLFDVYLSPDSNSVRNLAGFARVATRLTDTTFTPTTALNGSTYYYWRVYSRSATGDSIAGPMWSFRTFQNSMLSGTRFIGGTNPDFATIHDAINALNVMGAGTGVTFLIRGGTYTEVPDTIGIMAMTGANSRVVFRPADTSAVIINKQTTSSMQFAFKLQNASYITFDGSPASAPGRRVMTINATGTSYGYHTFWIVNGSNNNSIKNLNMTVGLPNTNSNASPVYVYFSSGTVPNVPCFNDSIVNCRINGGYYGMYLYSSSTAFPITNWYIAKNQVLDFGYYGIFVNSCANSMFTNNEIALTTPQSSTLSYLYGIYSSSTGNMNDVYNGNWIHDLNPTNTNAYIYGMYMYSGANKLISNNMINLDPGSVYYIYGIYLYSDRSDVLHNTIRIAGTGTTQQTYGIYFGTTTQDTLANNIVINERVATGGSYNTCLYSNSSVTVPPWSYSDYNLYTTVDTVTTDNRYVAYFAGNLFNTLSNLRANTNYVWDTHSVQIPPQFMGIPNLHIDLTAPTVVENAGRPFARVSSDVDGETRNPTTPDIGADEGNFVTGTDLYAPRISMTRLGLWDTTPRTFFAYITDNVGVATDSLRGPRVYYKLSTASTWNSSRFIANNDSSFTFSIPSFPMGSIVNYYVAAQDTARNSSTFPSGGRGSNPPGTTPPVNYAFYYINTVLTGVKTIGGTNPDYPTLNAAVSALNNIGVGPGGVTFSIRNGNYVEPSVTITSMTDPTRPVVFKVDSGATVTYTFIPTTSNFAGILLKSRYVTFDGSWPRDTVNKHLTVNGSTAYYTVWFSDSSAYNTIRYCILSDSMISNSNYRTVMFGNQSTFPPIVGNKLLYCDINGGYYAIYHYSPGGNEWIDSTMIQYCNIKNYYAYGIYMYYSRNINISYNYFFDTAVMSSGSMYAVYMSSSVIGCVINANRVSSILNSTTATLIGIYAYGTGNVYSNNMIDFNSSGTAYGFYSISGGGKFLFNSVNIHGVTTSTSYSSYAYYNSSSTPDTLIGNILQNTRTGPTTAGATNYHVCIWVQTLANIAMSNYNLLSVGSDSVGDNRYIGHIGTTTTAGNYNTFADFISSAWAPRDANSYPDLAAFVNDSNLHIQANVVTPIESGAPRHWQVPADFDGQARNTMADIGADEGNFRPAIYGTIAGVVRDSSTTRPPMPGVIVTAGRFADTTDATGSYSLLVRTGTYNVVAATACYDSMWAMNTVVDSGRTTTVNVDMLHPELSSDHTSLELVCATGQSRTSNLVITNTGNGPLHWKAVAIADPHQDAIGGGGTERPPVNISLVSGMDKLSSGPLSDIAPTHPSTSSTDQLWGPEAYGYQAMDNQEPTFPGYVHFREIRDIGTTVTSGYGSSTTTPMGCSFTYYGTVYTSLFVHTAGYVQFSTSTYSTTGNSSLPYSSIQNGVFVFHDALNTTVTKYYDSTASIFYLQWTGRQNSYSTDSTIFQLQLHCRINAMVFAYDTIVGTHATPTVGIQNLTGVGNRYIQCYYGTSTPFTPNFNDYMIAFNDMSPGGGGAFPSWLNVSPGTGTTAPHQPATLLVRVSVDTGVTVPAVWTGNIRITSDACPNVVMIPVSLSVTNAAPEAATVPVQYKLYQNYPNPFNPTTEIRFDLKQAGMTRLAVYNALGREVAQLVNDQLPAGFHSVKFDGSKLATGVYFYRIQSGKYSDVKKMVMLK